MRQPIHWLKEESKKWVTLGLVSPEQAQGILQLYPEPKSSQSWGTLIFTGIGVCMLGLGVILLFAFNWDAISKAEKLGVILGGVVLFHGIGVKFLSHNDWLRQLGDVSCVLGTMFFGAGIWLVAQIYHIDEHYPNGFLIWGMGALALAWVIPSLLQGVLAAILFGIWACCEAWGFESSVYWAPLLILGGVGTLAWWKKSCLLLSVVLAVFSLSLGANAGSGLVLRVMLFNAALFIAVGILVQRHKVFLQSKNIWAFFGWVGFLLCLYLLTFPEIAYNLLNEPQNGWNLEPPAISKLWRSVYTWGTFAGSLVAWGAVVWPWCQRKAKKQRDFSIECWLIPLTVVVSQILALSGLTGLRWEVAGVFNLVFLTVVVAWMAFGCREGNFRFVLCGSLLFVALAFARYFDLFESLAARGFVFLVVGVLLIGEGVLYRRRHIWLEGRKA